MDNLYSIWMKFLWDWTSPFYFGYSKSKEQKEEEHPTEVEECIDKRVEVVDEQSSSSAMEDENPKLLESKDSISESNYFSKELKRVLSVIEGEMTRGELQNLLNLKNNEHFRKFYLVPAISGNYIEMTLPDKPNSRFQKYRITDKGLEVKKNLSI